MTDTEPSYAQQEITRLETSYRSYFYRYSATYLQARTGKAVFIVGLLAAVLQIGYVN